jgi:hypothetical protein
MITGLLSARDASHRNSVNGVALPSRPQRRAFLRALALLPISVPLVRGSARGQSASVFQLGWNHPWIGYGHDFGRAWGHDGLSTSGWTCETAFDTQGFTDAQVTTDPLTGRGALRVSADLVGKHPNRSSGEVHISLIDHWPFPCPRPEAPTFVNLDGGLIRYRVRLPRGSAGSPSAPNGLQLVLKTRLDDERWPSLYTRWENISSSWEDRDISIVAGTSLAEAAQVDAGFDPRRVSLIGVKLSVNSASASNFEGVVYLHELFVDTDTALVFDFERLQIERDFRAVQTHAGRAFSVARIFVFCDGRASPRFGDDGHVIGLDELFYRDFDALLDAADRNRIRLMPTLLDFHWCAWPNTVSGVRLGGHAEIVRIPALRQTFLDRALRPLLERYANRDSIFAWDVINEPEWVIDGVPGSFHEGFDLVTVQEMREFVAACTQYVHRLAPAHLVTVGSARRNLLNLWTGLGLDLYQFHWYDKFRREEPFPWEPYDELGLDRPCIIGEVPTSATRFTPAQFIAAAQSGGYSGLLLWSYRARDAFSNLCSMTEEG